MRIHVWGSRGSLPAPLNVLQVQEKIYSVLKLADAQAVSSEEAIRSFMRRLPFHLKGTYGGNTSCVEVDCGSKDYILCDAGTGLRDFSSWVMPELSGQSGVFHILISHCHWDHIQGFPFLFQPIFREIRSISTAVTPTWTLRLPHNRQQVTFRSPCRPWGQISIFTS